MKSWEWDSYRMHEHAFSVLFLKYDLSIAKHKIKITHELGFSSVS